MYTSHKQHLEFFRDRPYARLLVFVLFLRYEYCLLDVAENDIAMRVVCLWLRVRRFFVLRGEA